MVQLPGVNTAAVQLVPLQAARASAAGAADLPARDPRRGRLLGRPPPPPRAVGRLQRGAGDPRQQARAQLADRYLARTAITGQQVDGMPIDGERPGNLFEPVEAKAATHGIFDAQAKTRSPQLWAATHRPRGRRRAGRRRARHRSACCARCDERERSAGRWHRRAARAARVRAAGRRRARHRSSARTATSPGCASRAGTRDAVFSVADRRRGRATRSLRSERLRLGRLLRAGQR